MKNKKGTLKAHRSDLRATDRQIGGKHYQLPISPLKFILANNLNFVDGNIVKSENWGLMNLSYLIKKK